MQKGIRNIYLFDGGSEPERFVQYEAHIKKVMSVPAVPRPKWDSSSNRLFDIKLDSGRWYRKLQQKDPVEIPSFIVGNQKLCCN